VIGRHAITWDGGEKQKKKRREKGRGAHLDLFGLTLQAGKLLTSFVERKVVKGCSRKPPSDAGEVRRRGKRRL